MITFKVEKKDVFMLEYRFILATRYLNPLFHNKPHCKLVVFLAIKELFEEKEWEIKRMNIYDEYIDLIAEFNSNVSPKQIARLLKTKTINALYGELNSKKIGDSFTEDEISSFFQTVNNSNLLKKEEIKPVFEKEVPNKSVWSGYVLMTTKLDLEHNQILNWLLAQSKS